MSTYRLLHTKATSHAQLLTCSALGSALQSLSHKQRAASPACAQGSWYSPPGGVWGCGAYLEYGWQCCLRHATKWHVLGAFSAGWFGERCSKKAEQHHCCGIVDLSLREHDSSPGSWFKPGFWAKNPWRVERESVPWLHSRGTWYCKHTRDRYNPGIGPKFWQVSNLYLKQREINTCQRSSLSSILKGYRILGLYSTSI